MNSSLNTREPSIIYLNISFLVLGIMQIVNIGFSSILILTIIIYRTLHTVPNLLTANSSFAIFIYALFMIAQIIIGLQPKTKENENLCIFLAYFTSLAVNGICYSYLVTAISQYFFNILYRRKYFLTFHIHWFIIILSWSISCILPLILYLPHTLQYASEMHMCTVKMSFQWNLFIYMGTAIGIPLFGIITIYFYIVRSTRRIVLINSTRDLIVLKNILTLISILGTAGLPNVVLVIWNILSMGKEPVVLYLICALTISFCTNIQILFIFSLNKNVRISFWNYLQHIFHFDRHI